MKDSPKEIKIKAENNKLILGNYYPILDATCFTMGAFISEEHKTPKIFFNKEEMWEYIKDLGQKMIKRKKILNIYAHNMKYDFYATADLLDKGLIYHSEDPFITSHSVEVTDKKITKKKECIKFLDTMNIFPFALKEVGEIIGHPKQDLPLEANLDDNNLNEVVPYMVNDTQIVLESIKMIQRKLKEEGCPSTRIYTINQVAIGYILRQFCKVMNEEWQKKVFYNPEKQQLWRPQYPYETHNAYRGGRIETTDISINNTYYEDIIYTDCNNLYGFAETIMRFPDLTSERKVWNPLKMYEIDDLLNKIGLSKCCIENISDEIGIIPIRQKFETNESTWYIKPGQKAIGTWTNIELQKALQTGHKIHAIEFSVLWEEIENPYKIITPRLFELRNKSGNIFDKYFYKQMINGALGKLAQTRSTQEMTIDSISKGKEYFDKGYQALHAIKTNYMYINKKVRQKIKKFYAPIIPTIVNATARVYMYDFYKAIGHENLIYTDTDSCIFKGKMPEMIKISDKLGEFKIVHEHVPIDIVGRKWYVVADEIKSSGMSKRDVTLEAFKNRKVKSQKMITIKTASNISEVGSFIQIEKDLNETTDKLRKEIKFYKEQKIMIDLNETNINTFLDYM